MVDPFDLEVASKASGAQSRRPSYTTSHKCGGATDSRIFNSVSSTMCLGLGNLRTRDRGDAPPSQMHRLDPGHFAVEDRLDEIAENIRRFYDDKVATSSTSERKTA
jgi:hypothetical protein